jgi:hypothetical protein
MGPSEVRIGSGSPMGGWHLPFVDVVEREVRVDLPPEVALGVRGAERGVEQGEVHGDDRSDERTTS